MARARWSSCLANASADSAELRRALGVGTGMDANHPQRDGDALEVVAQFDGSILDVQHLVLRPPDARAEVHKTRALLVGGGAALGLALLLFLISAHVTLPRAFDLVVTVLLSCGT